MVKNKRGFTLVEIIVVLVILAILAAIAIPSVIGYVDEAKEARELTKLRESLIAAQVSFVKSSALGEFSTNQTAHNKDAVLTATQREELSSYLEEKPYLLIYGVGASTYGTASKETSQVYCIIYRKTQNSKPWFYDGKKWSHRYLWDKRGNYQSQKVDGRAMYSTGNGNYMNGVKDSKGKDVAVTLHYITFNHKMVTNINAISSQAWENLKADSE